MADLATVVDVMPAGRSLLDRTAKKSSKAGIAAFLLALAGGLGYIAFHVARDLDKVTRGDKLSPILLVRGRFVKDRDLVVADGYHRICASYWLNENSHIPCRIVDVPA